METHLFSSIGTTTKKERLIINDRIDCKAALIFISEYPYAGYYGTTVPDKEQPKSAFLVTDMNYDTDKVIRAIQSVKPRINYNFDAAPGTISHIDRNMGMIRIRNISCKHVPGLIEEFKKEDIVFKHHHKFSPFDGIIRVTKYFKIEKIDDGIFIDCTFDCKNSHRAYLQIDKKLQWDTFEKIYRDVRNNIIDFSFDAALVTMYDENGMLDFIRIYDEHRTEEKLKILYKKFREVMASY